MQGTKLLKVLKDKAFTVIVLIASIGFYILAGNFEYTAKPGRLGPEFWPKMLITALIVLAVLEIGIALFKGDSKEQEEAVAVVDEESQEENPQDETKTRYPALLFIGIAMTVGYVLLVEYLGFALTTFLYLAGFMYVGRYRRKVVILASSLLGSVFLVMVFVKLVYVSLPIGTPPFDNITYLIYTLLGVN